MKISIIIILIQMVTACLIVLLIIMHYQNIRGAKSGIYDGDGIISNPIKNLYVNGKEIKVSDVMIESKDSIMIVTVSYRVDDSFDNIVVKLNVEEGENMNVDELIDYSLMIKESRSNDRFINGFPLPNISQRKIDEIKDPEEGFIVHNTTTGKDQVFYKGWKEIIN